MSTFLYVDDEATIGLLVSRFFKRRGDRVLLAASIAEAHAILAVEEPDAAFIDVCLGKESGVELVSWIAREHPCLLPRVTFVTGEHVDECAVGAFGGQIGCPVIRKPFELSTLAKFVDAAEIRAGT